jgi:predicted TIM-barrel fold metal-dependent hydrolase
MGLRFEPLVRDLLQGAIDLHVHAAPDLAPRRLDDIALARHAREMGLRAVLIKSHFESTASRAWLATQQTGFPVYGGLALNHPVGGLNPHAVEFALRLGARAVWLPTLDAAHFLAAGERIAALSPTAAAAGPGLRLLDPEGQLKPELGPILDAVAAHDAILATGHVGLAEARAVVREAARRGVARIVVTHPLASFLDFSLDDIRALLDLGATWLEHVYNDTIPHMPQPVPLRALYDNVRAVGAARCIMSTDAGQAHSPLPAHQFGLYMQQMLDLGLSPAEVRTMTADNPARALGL